ncbi:MAG: SDR family oxidoreductase [Longimicrobiales bacterium]|nr:SDR family oxidoreductase [Longimicrobiales bacterium]
MEGGELAGRTALVTGASRGIGKATVLRLTEAGARVWALARSGDALAALEREATQEAARDPRAESGSVESMICDVRDDAAVWLALDDLVERVGAPPDIVVNSAGVFGIARLPEETVNAFDAHLAVNLRAPFLVLRALLPGMLERGSGIVVNIGSVAGRKAFPGNAAYSASKFGLRGLHEVLVEELSGTGVRATLVEPSATDTKLWDRLDPDEDPDLPSRHEMLEAAQVADAVHFAVTRPPGVLVPKLRLERG